MTHKPATALPITMQELFDIIAADPRVKAYPRLVDSIHNLLAGVNMPTRAVQKAAALLRELKELG